MSFPLDLDEEIFLFLFGSLVFLPLRKRNCGSESREERFAKWKLILGLGVQLSGEPSVSVRSFAVCS